MFNKDSPDWTGAIESQLPFRDHATARDTAEQLRDRLLSIEKRGKEEFAVLRGCSSIMRFQNSYEIFVVKEEVILRFLDVLRESSVDQSYYDVVLKCVNNALVQCNEENAENFARLGGCVEIRRWARNCGSGKGLELCLNVIQGLCLNHPCLARAWGEDEELRDVVFRSMGRCVFVEADGIARRVSVAGFKVGFALSRYCDVRWLEMANRVLVLHRCNWIRNTVLTKAVEFLMGYICGEEDFDADRVVARLSLDALLEQVCDDLTILQDHEERMQRSRSIVETPSTKLCKDVLQSPTYKSSIDQIQTRLNSSMSVLARLALRNESLADKFRSQWSFQRTDLFRVVMSQTMPSIAKRMASEFVFTVVARNHPQAFITAVGIGAALPLLQTKNLAPDP